MASMAKLLRSSQELSWGDTAGNVGDRLSWTRKVGDMTETYISFLRTGIRCSCGTVLHQHAREAAVFRVGSGATSSPPFGGSSAAGAGATASDTVDLTGDEPMAAPPAPAKVASSATIDLSTDEEQMMAAIYGPSNPAPCITCTKCAKVYCAACGEGAQGGGKKAGAAADGAGEHARTCQLRWVHAVASAIEQLRKVRLGISAVMDVGAGDRVKAAHATVKQALAGSAGGSGAAAKPKKPKPAAAKPKGAAAGAGAGAAAPPAATPSIHGWQLADRALEAAYALAMGRKANAVPGFSAADELPSYLTPSIVENLVSMASASSGKAGVHGGSSGYPGMPGYGGGGYMPSGYDSMDSDGEDYDDLTPSSMYYPGMQAKAAAAMKGGTGYAGSANDAQIVKQKQEEARRKRAIEDAELAAVVRALQAALPRGIYDSRTGQGTDGASDHPLLLQMLVGPGFADGLPVLLPTEQQEGEEEPAAAAAATAGASPARAGKRGSLGSAGAAAGAGASNVVTIEDDEVMVIKETAPAKKAGRGKKRGAEEMDAPAPSPPTKRAATAVAAAGTGAAAGPGVPTLPTTPGIAVPGSEKKVGSGDGLNGGSVLYGLLNELLRTSVMDMATDEPRRALFFSVLHLLQHVGAHPQLAGFLVYTPPEMTAQQAGAGAGAGSSKAAAKAAAFNPWLYPQGILEEEVKPASAGEGEDADAPVTYKVLPPATCVATLLEELKGQAVIYKKRTVAGDSAPEVLMGSGDDSKEYTAVLGLCVDVEDGAGKVHDAVTRWGAAHADLLDNVLGGVVAEDEVGYVPEASGAGAGAGAAGAGAKTRGRKKAVVLAPVVPANAIAEPGAKTASGALIDPATESTVGVSKLPYTPPALLEREYKGILRDECYYTISDLAKEHSYRPGATGNPMSQMGGQAVSTALSSTAGNMRRHMKVSAEMASLAAGNVHWNASILVRSDESNGDMMRAAITGPPDTPYAGGFYQFDILLPSTYPESPPHVKYLTTGGGTCRFNPNLYSEGKVCLSLLGTWSGPGWVPGTSTLNQVLISVQSQIMNEMPFANEPGHESMLGTPAGKRSVAKHNCAIRLANLRHAMLDVIKKPPKGFERASKAHFFYKREELTLLANSWATEAQAAATYEAYLVRRVEGLRRVIAPAWEAEFGVYCKDKIAKQEEAKKKQEEANKKAMEDAAAAASAGGKKKGGKAHRYDPYSYNPSYYGSSAAAAMPVFKPSAGLKKALDEYDTAYKTLTKWWTDTSASSHEVFGTGLGAGGASAATKAAVSAAIEGHLAGSDALAPAQKMAPTIASMGYAAPVLTFPAYGVNAYYNPTAAGATVNPTSAAPDPYSGYSYSGYSSSTTSNPANMIYVQGSGYTGGYAGSYYGSYSGASSGTTFQYSVANPQRTKWFDLACSTLEAAGNLATAMAGIKKEDLEEQDE